jgi:hypothetical protein
MTDHQIETPVRKRDLVALAECPVMRPWLERPGALECGRIFIQRYNGARQIGGIEAAGSRTEIQHALTGPQLK